MKQCATDDRVIIRAVVPIELGKVLPHREAELVLTRMLPEAY